jgi:hypothetical protein
MSRYAVDVHLTISRTIYVSAYDAEDAREEAANTISEEDFDFSDAEIVIGDVVFAEINGEGNNEW